MFWLGWDFRGFLFGNLDGLGVCVFFGGKVDTKSARNFFGENFGGLSMKQQGPPRFEVTRMFSRHEA